MDTAARRRGVPPLLVTGLLLALAPLAAAQPWAPLREHRRQLHGQQHLPVQPRAARRGDPRERVPVGNPVRHGRRRRRPGRRLRAGPLPRGHQRLRLRGLRHHGVPGRAAAVPLLQGRDGAVRPLLPALLQPEHPRLQQQRQPRLARQHPERDLAGAGFRGRRRRSPQRHRRLRGGQLVQEVRYGGGGLRRQQPHHLRAHAVHAGHVARRLPELPREHNRGVAAAQREPGREGHWAAVQFQVRGVFFLLRRPVAAAARAVLAGAVSCARQLTPTATPPGRRRNKMGNVAVIALPIAAAVLAISTVCLCFLWRRRRPAREQTPSYSTNDADIESIDSLLLDLSTLRTATDNFAESNRLGEGGFGAVYKGVLPDGQEIAVKRLSQSSGQGIQELKNELVLVAKLQQKNLVRLLGVCLQEHEKLLVYEYMPNRSIDTILFDPEKSKELDWANRVKIINGIARGLQYLHEDSQLKIIHRDLKASNVLLDSDYTPKISDFGLARLFGGDQSREITSRVVGTYGYMSPEYAMRGHYSIKSDVFSFGVLILEILTGRRSSGSFNFEQSVDLLSLVWEHWTTGTIVEIMDPSLRGKAPAEEMLKCVHIGLLCVQDNPVDRPMMSTVNIMLSSGTVSLQAPLKPVFLIPKSGYYSTAYSKTYPTANSQSTSNAKSGSISPNEVSITELEPR